MHWLVHRLFALARINRVSVPIKVTRSWPLAVAFLILSIITKAESKPANFVIPLNGVEMEWVVSAFQVDGGYYKSKDLFQPDTSDIVTYCHILTGNCRNRGFDLPDNFEFAYEDGYLVARVPQNSKPPPGEDPIATIRPTKTNTDLPAMPRPSSIDTPPNKSTSDPNLASMGTDVKEEMITAPASPEEGSKLQTSSISSPELITSESISESRPVSAAQETTVPPTAEMDSIHPDFKIPLNGIEMEWVIDKSHRDGGYYRSKDPVSLGSRNKNDYCRWLTFDCYNRSFFFPNDFGFDYEDGRLVAKAGLSRPLVDRKSVATPKKQESVPTIVAEPITEPRSEEPRSAVFNAQGDAFSKNGTTIPWSTEHPTSKQESHASQAPPMAVDHKSSRMDSGIVPPSNLPPEIPGSTSASRNQPVSVTKVSNEESSQSLATKPHDNHLSEQSTESSTRVWPSKTSLSNDGATHTKEKNVFDIIGSGLNKALNIVTETLEEQRIKRTENALKKAEYYNTELYAYPPD